MRSLTISIIGALLALFALPTFADDALIAELIRLDETRRAETKTLHVEFDVATQIGDAMSFEAPGNVWEQHGENKYRFRCRSQAPSEDPRRKGELLDYMVEGSFDGSDKYLLVVPYEEYPVEGPLDPNCYHDVLRNRGSILRNTKMLNYGGNPFLGTHDASPPSAEYSVFYSYKEFFESYAPKRVEKLQNEDGDEIVQVEFEAKEERWSLWKEWALTIDFNLSKGGLLSKYSHSWAPKLPSELSPDFTGKIEITVNRFEESASGRWYPQETQVVCDQGDPAGNVFITSSINKYSVNDESALQLGDARFPPGLIVREEDTKKPQKTKYHIWGDGKPAKTFTSSEGLRAYLENPTWTRFLPSILTAGIVLATALVLVVLPVIHGRLRKKIQKKREAFSARL